MRIASVGRALPEHYYDQRAITRYLETIWAERPAVLRRLESLHENVLVEGRYLALPIERYPELVTFGQFNDAWIEAALELGERALTEALERAGLRPDQVDAIFFSTVTGLASPSIDARLINRMPLRTDLKRVPMFGLGCVAGAAAVSRAADYVRGHPDGVAAVLTIELGSLTLQRDDPSVANLISTGLFGDGASAAIVVGEARAEAGGGDGPRIVDTRSIFYPETEDVMGWHIGESGFRIVLSTSVPTIAQEQLGTDVDAFLGDHGMGRGDIAAWVCHPGGPKVLAGLRDGLGLSDEDLALSWESLRKLGNLSSASVLMILRATMDRRRPRAGEHGLMLALGPGFCSELLLLEW